MFKPGDKALVRKTGQTVIVEEMIREASEYRVIKTSGGPFHEDELQQAHETVLKTIAAEVPKWPVKEENTDTTDILPTWEKRHKLLKLIDKAKFDKLDIRGHWKRGENIYDLKFFKQNLTQGLMLMHLNKQDCDDLTEVLEYNQRKRKRSTKKALDRWVSLRMGWESHKCSFCLARNLQVETNGVDLRLSGEECPLPDGFEPNVFELNVPSGKLVVDDDLRNWFPLAEDGNYDINTAAGTRKCSQLYADVGLAHGFVGNTCPGIYKKKDGTYKIASQPYDEYWDSKTGEMVPNTNLPEWDGESVGTICTDLWWYSICDYEEFERRIAKYGLNGYESIESSFTVIDVKPGVYRFQHHDGWNDDTGKEVLYAEFEWVREPGPVTDFLTKYSECSEVNPHAYVQQKAKTWPTLYGKVKDAYGPNEQIIPWEEMTEKDRQQAWLRVANQIFFTIGGGIEWHENGWPAEKVQEGIADIEPPNFRFQGSWYPFSKGYGGLFGSVKLSPSFAKYAMRCLESIVSFGTNVHDGEKCRDVTQVRERMLVAVEKYRELMKLYPEAGDPDYVWWFSQPGRAETWVENFMLGPKYTDKHRKHVEQQRWVPEDAYAIEFDARKLKESGDAGFSGKFGWAKKESATGFAIEQREPSQDLHADSNCWLTHAIGTAIPLYSVAKVVKLGEVSHMGNTLVELSFEYGNEWMQDSKIRKAVKEHPCKEAIRVLTKKEYEKLLPEAKDFFEKQARRKK